MPQSTTRSVKSVGYGEKAELSELNDYLASLLPEMERLEEETRDSEAKIAQLEAAAAAEVKKATATLDRKNTKLKDDHQRDLAECDRLQVDRTEKAREIEKLMALKLEESAKLEAAEADIEMFERDIASDGKALPDLRAELAAIRKQNAELRKKQKELEAILASNQDGLRKKLDAADALAKKVGTLKDRLLGINTAGHEDEQRHKYVIESLEGILTGAGNIDEAYRQLKEALKTEHDDEFEDLIQEKIDKWRFELNKKDNEVNAAQQRADDANRRRQQAEADLGAMETDRDKLLEELERLRLELAAEAENVPYSAGDLDALIAQYEAMLAKRTAEIRRLEKGNSVLAADLEKLEAELARLKELVAAARLALAKQAVLYNKALENIQNCDDRAEAEDEELQDALNGLKAVVADKAGQIKDINDELQELRKMELDIAGMRAEIEEYRRLLDQLPDPSNPGTSPDKPAKRARTSSGPAPTAATPQPRPAKRPKVQKPAAKSTTKKPKASAAKVTQGADMDLNDDGRTTRSEARAYRQTGAPATVTVAATSAGDVVIHEDLINTDGYTQLTNHSDKDVDLSGWRIKAHIGRMQQKFPKGTTIEAGGSLYIYAKNTAKDADTDNNIVWKTREQTKGDDNDILELYDANGKMVQRYSMA